MISALVFALLAAGPPSVAPSQDPPIHIWLNNDRHFARGERAQVQIQTEDDGYVVVLHADPDGRVRVLFPIDPGDDNFIRGGHRYQIRGRSNRESFTVDASSGGGVVYAAVSHDPLRFEDFVQGDHWDYRALNATELASDPEPDLTDLVRRMSPTRFDYDVLSYDVSSGQNVAYYGATPYVRNTYYQDPFCDFNYSCDPYYFNGRSGLSVNLIFGRRYASSYDPYYYDPFYYGGYGYRGYNGYGGYGGYGYGGYSNYGYSNYGYSNRNTYVGRIYTPYQFKSVDRNWTTNRQIRVGRTDPRQATHTVYGPPIVGRGETPQGRSPNEAARDDGAEMRRRRVESGRTEGRPSEGAAPAPDRKGGEARRADVPRDDQRARQDNGKRRFETMPRPDAGASREQKSPAARFYQPQTERGEQRPPMREQSREQPRAEPQRQQSREQPRVSQAPQQNRSYARPSESNRKR